MRRFPIRSWKMLILALLLLVMVFPVTAGAQANPEGVSIDSKGTLEEPIVGPMAVGVNVTMTGPSSLSVGQTGTWRGNALYEFEVTGIPVPYRYDFEMGFRNTELRDHRVTGGNITLNRTVVGSNVWFRSGNLYVWTTPLSKYATVTAIPRNGYAGISVSSVTNATQGAFWSDSAYVWTDIKP